MMLEAPQAVQEWGRIVADVDLPMVLTARAALDIGTRRLQAMAIPTWRIDIDARMTPEPRLGDAVRLSHPHLPEGIAMVRSIAKDRGRPELAMQLTMPAGTLPDVRMIRQGLGMDAEGGDPLSVLYRDGMATFTILDDAGNALGGASVTLDGMETRSTDRFGVVQFETERGPHTLFVVALGYEPFEIGVVV